MYVCMYVCMYVYIDICVCIHVFKKRAPARARTSPSRSRPPLEFLAPFGRTPRLVHIYIYICIYIYIYVCIAYIYI